MDPKGPFLQAISNWLTREPAPERYVELLRVTTPTSKNTVPRAYGGLDVCSMDIP